MTGRAADSHRHPNLQSPGDHYFTDTVDELVRILAKLTIDVERFDSIVLLQRKMIGDRIRHPSDADHDQLRREAETIRIEAAEMGVRARQALDELRRLGEQTRLPAPHAAHRARLRGLARDRQAG